MSKVIENIIAKARSAGKTIVLPEADDQRVLLAAQKILAEGYAKIILLGDPAKIQADAKACSADIAGAQIVNPLTDSARDSYIDTLWEKRKAKGMTREDAEKMMNQVVFYGGAMLAAGRADGVVVGSICPTADTCRSALFTVGLKSGIKTLSSCSIMITVAKSIGVEGAVIFADTGVLPEPTAEQLADIGILASEACEKLLGVPACTAMLSFSTKGSASPKIESVKKVIDATELIKQRRPDLNVDGELQLDAAVIPAIGERKCKGSKVAGKANTLVFPDLSCGNIGYKLVERLGNATALGPLLMGPAKPINDLSRGCSVDDIALITAITAVQSC
ncbi:MAG TPA: phosphate acetyltransferase [Phycisphaerae bacterium]|nr:phosphate acetyltransferase [Phycisphaerae bacterium]